MKEISARPKFDTKFLADSIPDIAKINSLKYWCRKFCKAGLMPFYGSGSFGNMSFRIKGNSFLITASGIKDPSSNESFVMISSVDLEKRIVYAHGKRKPSSESMMHYLIYKNRKDVNAIFHGHSDELLKYHRRLGIPSTIRDESYGTVRLAKSVLDVLDNHFFMIMKGHGFISVGKNMDKAGKRTLEILKMLRSRLARLTR